MLDISRIILEGLILSGTCFLIIIASLYYNPRIWLQDYPKDIQDKVPPKNKKEKQLFLLVGIPLLLLMIIVPFLSTLMLKQRSVSDISLFLLSSNAFGVIFIFNIVDLLIIDWLMFCKITPRFIVIPGSEGLAGYKDYWFHFTGFLIGTAFSVVISLVIGTVVSLF